MKRTQKGFTLIELLIVIAVIAILAAIAIPNLLKSRMAANEASAIASLRTIVSAQETYRARQNPPTYASLGELNTQTLIDSKLGTGSKSGYTFAIPANTAVTYSVTATPQTNAGERHFFVNESGVIRSSNGSAASVSSDPIE